MGYDLPLPYQIPLGLEAARPRAIGASLEKLDLPLRRMVRIHHVRRAHHCPVLPCRGAAGIDCNC